MKALLYGIKPFLILVVCGTLNLAHAKSDGFEKRFDRDFGWWYSEKKERKSFILKLYPVKRVDADKIALFLFRYSNRRCVQKDFTIKSGKGMNLFSRHLSNSHRPLHAVTVTIQCQS